MNRTSYAINALNELEEFTYDTNGNLKMKGPFTFSYDALNRLTEVSSNDTHITTLIDSVTKTPSAIYSYNAFGEMLSSQEQVFNPWRTASKRLDPETELIYFGKRYYVPDLGRWLTPDPAGFIDSVNLYQYVFNNPFRYTDPDGQFAIAIPLITWGSKLVMASLPTIAGYLGLGFATAAVAYGGYKLTDSLNYRSYSAEDHFYFFKNIEIEEETKKKQNTNPFEGPVSEDVVIVDEAGNAIQVPEGNWLTGTEDGKWIQEMQPGGPKGQPTGLRKDGGGHPPPKHTDIRANGPHAHVPGITNADGTEWLPLRK